MRDGISFVFGPFDGRRVRWSGRAPDVLYVADKYGDQANGGTEAIGYRLKHGRYIAVSQFDEITDDDAARFSFRDFLARLRWQQAKENHRGG